MTTLLVSQGVPMFCHGDELGRTQGGNNNGYCQDNEVTWIDWNLDEDEQAQLEFTRKLVQLRHDNPVLRRRRFLTGTPTGAKRLGDSAWYNADGSRMTDEAWNEGHARSVMMFLNGDGMIAPDAQGHRIVGDSFLLVFNAWHESIDFSLPGELKGQWFCAIDTDDNLDEGTVLKAGATLTVHGRSTVIMQRTRHDD